MDKKTIIIVGALVLVLIFYFQILEFLGVYKPAPPPPETDQTVLDSGAVVANDTIPPEFAQTEPAETVTAALTPAVDSIKSDTSVIDIPNETIRVETNKYIVTLNSHGGGPVSMLLKDYTYRNGEMIEMIPEAKEVTPDLAFAGETFKTSSLPFVSSKIPGTYSAASDNVEIVYTYTRPEGGEIKRIFTFFPDSYHYDLKVQVNDPEKIGLSGRYALIWNTPLGVTEPQEKIDYEAMQAAALLGGSFEKLDDFDDGQLRQSIEGYTAWGGLRSKYFAAVMIPKSRDAEAVFARGNIEPYMSFDGDEINKKEIIAGINMPFVTTFVDSFQVYVGPLDYITMSDYDVELEDMLDIGTTPVVGMIIKPFAIAVIYLLPWLYDFIPNYGFVIILFALLVKLVTLPLSMKSFKSMNAMKEIQPLIEELKKKHAKNPQKMNSEMMALYKKHGVNPISGCLPMLPQMPLFFALFSVFRSTILLRDAPFIFFIDDLSRGAASFTDPYIVLVVIMVISQFVSQKLTMSGGQQQKMFLYIMPVFMGYIFHTFAAGLVLYWACFSIFSLIDYFLFKRNSLKNQHVQTA